MLIKWIGTSAISVYPKNNLARVTLNPGNILSVKDEVYDQLHNQYPTSIEIVSDDSVTQVDTITITTAEVLALNTTPKQLIVAPGAGYAIIVERVVASIDYDSAAYATNVQLEFRFDDSTAGDGAGSEVTTASIDSLLDTTADKISVIDGLGQAETAPTLNKGVSAIVATGDPVTGDSDVKVKIFYKVISI